MDNNDYNNVEEIRYVNEYRKISDIFSLKKNGEKTYLEKLILQTFISLITVTLLMLITSIDTKLTNYISNSVKNTMDWNVDLSKTVETFSNLRNLIPNAKKVIGINSFNADEGFIMPVDGIITSSFGIRVHPVFNTEKMHNGIDIDAEIGTPIRAATTGRVMEVGEDYLNGKYIKLENGQYVTIYAHCNMINVKKDDSIKQGDIIGEVGDTGLTSGPHLHFEIHENGMAIDPIDKFNNKTLQ
jgi:murein DD-endopeptidase MepM/ murein hydrolase activator NlpD